jgi:hypothetical protein
MVINLIRRTDKYTMVFDEVLTIDDAYLNELTTADNAELYTNAAHQIIATNLSKLIISDNAKEFFMNNEKLPYNIRTIITYKFEPITPPTTTEIDVFIDLLDYAFPSTYSTKKKKGSKEYAPENVLESYLLLYSLDLKLELFPELEYYDDRCIQVFKACKDIQKMYKPSINHQIFSIICNHDILEEGNEFNELCLAAAFYTGDIPVIEKVLNYKIMPDKLCVDAIIDSGEIGDYDEILSLLVTAGYQLTSEDIGKLMKIDIYLDPKKFPIKIDDEFYCECLKKKPKVYSRYKKSKKKETDTYLDKLPEMFKETPPGMKVLQTACEYGNVIILDELINNIKLVPDQQCLELACKNKSNNDVMIYLLNMDIKPTTSCFINIAESIGNKCLTTLCNAFTGTYIKTENSALIESKNPIKKMAKVRANKKTVAVKATKKVAVKKKMAKAVIEIDSDSYSESEDEY